MDWADLNKVLRERLVALREEQLAMDEEPSYEGKDSFLEPLVEESHLIRQLLTVRES